MCTCYKHNLRWKGKTSIFSPSINWPVLPRERHKHQPDSELPSSGAELVQATCSLQSKPASKAVRTVWSQESTARERCGDAAIEPGGETAGEIWEGQATSRAGQAASRARSTWFSAAAAERTSGLRQGKPSFNPRHQNCRPQNQLPYFQIQIIVLHGSHKNVTLLFL